MDIVIHGSLISADVALPNRGQSQLGAVFQPHHGIISHMNELATLDSPSTYHFVLRIDQLISIG